VSTILTSSLLCSYFFNSPTDFEFALRKETINSFFFITPKNLKALDSFLEGNAMGTGKAACAKKTAWLKGR
jgi:hypothetical protein